MTDLATTTGGSLAITPDQTGWTPQQQAVLQQSGINKDVTSAELSGFLHLCQRTQLDPFSRQIYLIGRWNNRERRKVFTPQTSIDGYRVIAHRAAARAGHSLGYEDTLWCDTSGQWQDVWLSEAAPAAAKVTVVRDGQRFSAVARYSEYVQTDKDGKPSGLWPKMGATMIAKCAESLALRKAFPHDLAGVYTAEEMAQADQPERHLKSVEKGEPDPWATEIPSGTTAMHGRSQDAQDVADAANDATTQGMVKKLYQGAHSKGLLVETVKVDRELLELGAYLIARGKELASPAPKPEPEVVEGVVVEDVQLPTDEHAAAVAALRAFGAEHGITDNDLDAQAYSALGASLDDVAPKAIWDLLSQLQAA